MAAIGWNEAAAVDANRFKQGKSDPAAYAGDAAYRDMERRQEQVAMHVDEWRETRQHAVGDGTGLAAYNRKLAKAKAAGTAAHHPCSGWARVDAVGANLTVSDHEAEAVDADAEAEAARRKPAPPPPAAIPSYRAFHWPKYPPGGGHMYAMDCGRCGELVRSPTELPWRSQRGVRCDACAEEDARVDAARRRLRKLRESAAP